jgi:DNA modification methylase
MSKQLSLFDHIGLSYLNKIELSNSELYELIPDKVVQLKSNTKYNEFKRKIRWQQQTMKQLGLLERVEDKKATWRLTEQGKSKLGVLHQISSDYKMIAFSTKLGLAIWADSTTLYSNLDIPITLCLSSPPYPLNATKAYGNVTQKEYVDWICKAIEPIIKNLRDGGSIVLNLGNDVFIQKSPARSTYRERMIIAFEDNLGLYKMDEIPWINKSKPPGPTYWASITRQQLNCAWEPIYWFTNNPIKCLSNNNRVLQPHSEQHLKYLQNKHLINEYRINSDGAHIVRNTSYNNITKGKIPKNIFERGHKCKDQDEYKKYCKEINIPYHGASFPLDLAKFFISFLSDEEDLIVDPFGGSLTVAKGAEELNRRWLSSDNIWQYLRGAFGRFKTAEINPNFEGLLIS